MWRVNLWIYTLLKLIETLVALVTLTFWQPVWSSLYFEKLLEYDFRTSWWKGSKQ